MQRAYPYTVGCTRKTGKKVFMIMNRPKRFSPFLLNTSGLMHIKNWLISSQRQGLEEWKMQALSFIPKDRLQEKEHLKACSRTRSPINGLEIRSRRKIFLMSGSANGLQLILPTCIWKINMVKEKWVKC